MLTDTDRRFLRIAYDEAREGFEEGGCPIGSVLARGETLVSRGRNQRVELLDSTRRRQALRSAQTPGRCTERRRTSLLAV